MNHFSADNGVGSHGVQLGDLDLATNNEHELDEDPHDELELGITDREALLSEHDDEFWVIP